MASSTLNAPGNPSVQDDAMIEEAAGGTSSTDRSGKDDADAADLTGKEPPKPAGPPMPPPPVDGGWLCWLQVVASFAMWTNSWGIVSSFGVFQTYYEITNLSNKSPSQISWIGSIQAFLLCSVGALSGPLYDAGWCRWLVLVGNSLVVFGLMMTSICEEYWQVVLAQGIVVGVGIGCLFIPSTGILPQYFVKKRGLASCLAATGSAIGGIVYPIIFRELQPRLGFGWALRVHGFVALFLGVVASVAIKNKLPSVKPRQLLDPEFRHHIPIVIFTIGGFFLFVALYIPPNYIGLYALSPVETGEDMAFYIVAIVQAGSIIGRVLPALWVDRFGAVNVVIPSMLICGIFTLCWIAIKNEAGLIVFGLLYGAGFGLVLAMMPLSYMMFLKGDVKKFGTYLGMAMFFASPGVLIGNPVSGAILDASGFIGLQAFAGCMALVAGFLFLAARVAAVGWGVSKI